MLKKIKKVIAFALALTMLMGMGTMVSAAEKESSIPEYSGILLSFSAADTIVPIPINIVNANANAITFLIFFNISVPPFYTCHLGINN